METVELRGVTLFILLPQSWKFIECDGCQLRRHNERLSLIGRGEAFPISGGETEIRAPLQRIITIKRGNARQKRGRAGKEKVIIKIEAVCSACSQPLHLHVSPFSFGAPSGGFLLRRFSIICMTWIG